MPTGKKTGWIKSGGRAGHLLKHLIICALVFPVALAARAQSFQCPQTDASGISIETPAQALEGRLVYHDGMRKWFELKFDRPVCEKESIQLTSPRSSEELAPLRGCKVQTKGVIDFTPTTYYMLELFQAVDQIKPTEPCPQQPALEDYSAAFPDKAIRKYRVEMKINYTPGDHPIIFKVTSHGRELRPWKAYASYRLTGDYVLYGSCGKGFVVEKVFGNSLAKPSHSGLPKTSRDFALFVPELAAEAGVTDIEVGYSCTRSE